MVNYGYTPEYLTRDGRPWFPIMGEFHYTRYPEKYWEESIYKMKAGGLDVISTYTFWIHHEEVRGEYEFTGNRDLRKFVQACQACDIKMFLRIGPWCHGEVRNGGFPDWMLQQDFEPRTNDPNYFDEVHRFYTKIFKQVEGLLHKDGGPIIGVQIENEYGHCGGLTGEAGEAHMEKLTKMAKDIGFDVPYYTATGWGGAMTGGLLPVMGGYCEAPWDQRLTEIEPSGNYIFTHERNDHNIGSDFGFGAGMTFDMTKFPYLTAELGGGLQVTHHRRPIASAKDIGAMSLVKLGSGVNLLGYYMYHGGTNPKGKLSSLQESKATGDINDYPELNYDFHTAIREYGQMSDTLKELKLYAMFIEDFGEEFCRMPAVIPEDNPLYATNHESLRYSYRHNGQSGYVFVNNYQRGYEMASHHNVHLKVALPHEDIAFSKIHVHNEDYYFYPFNMILDANKNTVLKSATVTPLCKLNNDQVAYVFYGDHQPNYRFNQPSEEVNLITLSRRDAMNAWKVRLDKDYLFVTEANVVEMKDGIHLFGENEVVFKSYPSLENVPQGFSVIEEGQGFGFYRKNVQSVHEIVRPTMNLINEREESRQYQVDVEYVEGAEDVEDYFLTFDYDGDQAEIYLEGEKVADHFYTGEPMEVSMRRFGFPKEVIFKIIALDEEAKIYLEHWPNMACGKACKLKNLGVRIEFNHKVML
jgi:hypothetical protein